MCGWMDRWDGWVNGRMCVWMDGGWRMNKSLCVDGWVGGWVNGRMCVCGCVG